MNGPKTNVDFFGSYLSRVSDGGSEAPVETPESSGQPERKLMDILAKFGHPVPIKALMSITALPPSVIMKTLGSLSETGLIDMASTESDETAAITDLGKKIFGSA